MQILKTIPTLRVEQFRGSPEGHSNMIPVYITRKEVHAHSTQKKAKQPTRETDSPAASKDDISCWNRIWMSSILYPRHQYLILIFRRY